MVDDLLDFASNKCGNPMPVSPVRLNLKALCNEVLVETQRAHLKRTLRFKPKRNLIGEWDPSRLRQLISNLLVNALEHGATTTPVDVRSR